MKKVCALILCVTMALALSACSGNAPSPAGSAAPSAAAKPVVFKAACTQNAKDNMAIHLKAFCDEVTAKTNGSVAFEFYPNGELGTLAEVREMVMNNANIIMSEGCDNLGDVVPDISILNAPYAFSSYDDIKKLIKSDWFDTQCDLLSQKGIRVLALNWLAGSRCLIGNTAVRTAADMKGKIVRCPGNALFTGFMASVGASPTTSNWNEVYTGLSNKVFDMAEANIALLYSSSLFEVADYLNLSYHNYMNTGLVMSETLFAALSSEQQNILLDCAFSNGAAYTAAAEKAEVQAVEDFRAAGIDIVETDRASLMEATSSIFGDIPNWTPGLYESVRAVIAK